ncbi:MAG: type II toxin-antitoxin system VapC family toxin [Alphaproteobacteria bacterium]
MSGLLLDSHVLIWWMQDPGLIAAPARETIRAAEVSVAVSTVALWEIAIKESNGKLKVDGDLWENMQREDMHLLPVFVQHIEIIKTLPFYHLDPFDRIMIAQAQREDMTMVTRDRFISAYDVKVLPA